MAALMQEATISKQTLFIFHHTPGTQFVESGIRMCCTPDTQVATPRIRWLRTCVLPRAELGA